MKRKLLIILAFCLLLTGCGSSAKESTLLKNREAFDDAGTLWSVPLKALDALEHPSLYAFGDDLLAVSSEYVNDGESTLTLTLLDGYTGEQLKSCALSSGDSTQVQILGEHIAISDNALGTVVVLDAKLKETARYELTPDETQWFLGADLDTLYKLGYEDGVRAVSLSTQKEKSVLEMAELSICGVTGTDVCFTGVDRETLKCRALCLDLANGEIVQPPFSGDFSAVARNGELWLASFYGDESAFAFGTDENARTVTEENGTFSLLEPSGNILFTDYDGKMSLYDKTGKFISSCTLTDLYAQDFIWREELGGYLLTAGDTEGNCKLLFWDVSAGTKGEALQTKALSERSAVPAGKSADASLYKRAQALSERFGVEILIADQCGTEFPSFTCYQLSDYDAVSAGLDTLESALSAFPDGFLDQLAYGHIERTQFQLVGGLTADKDFGGDTSYAAFTKADGDVCRIVLDAYTINKNSVWHELSHAIDKRLAWDAAYREGAVFSEDGWMSRNPDGFSYSENYASQRTDIKSDWYSYFIDDYSMISASEDRARIFENAVENSGTLFSDAGLKDKLQYYCDCIRDCFDTTGWPKTTAWEAPLR